MIACPARLWRVTVRQRSGHTKSIHRFARDPADARRRALYLYPAVVAVAEEPRPAEAPAPPRRVDPPKRYAARRRPGEAPAPPRRVDHSAAAVEAMVLARLADGRGCLDTELGRTMPWTWQAVDRDTLLNDLVARGLIRAETRVSHTRLTSWTVYFAVAEEVARASR
jgi:hypothetical protein